MKKNGSWHRVELRRKWNILIFCPQALCQEAVCAEKSGFVTKIHTEEIGRICMLLGGGRAKKGDPIDLSVGLVLRKKVGDPVHSGESLAILHANDREKLAEAKERLFESV